MKISADFEKIIILELQREYLEICKTRKINLKNPVIVLSDHISKWGEYDPLTKIITVARKLVQNFSWAHVTGVLKHELAHQYVFEVLKKNTENPHGEDFQKACEKLAVPMMYRSSKLELIEENPDFTLDHFAEKNHLIEKVKKLMSLAASSNENEAALAATKVRELYLKYNLQHVGLETEMQFHHLVIELNKKRVSLSEKKVISILVEFYFVKAIIVQIFNTKSLQHESGVEVLGKSENVLMADYVFHFLLQICETLIKKSEKENHKKLDRSEKESMRLGILDGFAQKLKNESQTFATKIIEINPELNLNRQKSLLSLQESHLDDYLSVYFPRLRTIKSTGRRIIKDHYENGLKTGKLINLNKPIEKKGSLKRLLLKN